MADELRFTLLNGVTAHLGERTLALGPPQRRAVLCALALRPRQWVPRTSLLDALYEEDAPVRATKVVQTHVSALRRALEPHRAAGAPSGVLVSGHGGYQLRVADGQLDVGRFEMLVAEAQRARWESRWGDAEDRYARALNLFGGEPLAGVPGPYAERRRVALTERRLVVLEDSLETAVESGQPGRAVERLRLAAAEHPLRERLHALLMRALYAGGRQAEALQAYGHARDLLVDRLGVEPGAELRSLHALVLSGGELPRTRTTARGGAQGTPRGERPDAAPAVSPLRQQPAVASPAVGAFGGGAGPVCVGREGELALIAGLVDRVATGGGLVVVEGGAGAGKTRLLREAASRTPGARWLPLAEQGPGPALLPALRAALGRPPRDTAQDAADARGAADQAIRLLDAAEGPLVLFADDAHESDPVTREAIAHLARATLRRPVLLVLATSPAPLTGADTLWHAALEAEAVLTLPLGPLDASAVAELVRRRTQSTGPGHPDGGAPLTPLSLTVRQITSGLPVLVDALIADLDPRRHQDGLPPDFAPDRFARAVSRLLHRNDPACMLLVKALAVLAPHDPDAETLAAVCGQPLSATYQSCALLVRRGVFASAEPPRLHHPVVATAILRSCTPEFRARINVAAARQAQLAGRSARYTADHLLDLSGPQWSTWATTLVDAADDSLREGAGAQALRYLETAARITTGSERAAVLLHLGQAELQTNPSAARLHLQEALHIQRDRAETPTAVVPLAWVMVSQGRPEAATQLMDAVIAETESVDPAGALALRGAGWMITSLTPEPWHALMRELRALPPERIAADPVATALLVYDDAARVRITAKEALERFPTARTVAECSELPRQLGGLLALVAMWCDRISLVEDLCDRPSDQEFAAVDLYRVMLRAEMALRRGDHRRVLDECRLLAGVPLDQQVRRPVALVALYARALVGLGRLDEAQRWLDSVTHYADPESWPWTVVLYVRGMLCSAQGDPERAAAYFLESGRRIAVFGLVTPGYQTWRCSAALELARVGRHEEAHALAEEALDVAVRWGAPRFVGLAWRALAAAAPPHQRIPLLQKALVFLERGESPIDVATALADLADEWTAAGDPDRARPLLHRARETAESLHAVLLLERLDRIAERTPRQAALVE
ncbi:BTAD domain-containing putative transcriptional regulator [Streptomyces sp. NPDC001941]|uniref:BTAD domain-containing putative transcriptional regulator n=1 Tax=Streptomyces sp. NPDC001941 TaxID=3154659 RepID=UPI00332BBF5C